MAPLEQARAAIERQAWAEAYAQFTALERETPLDLGDLERLGLAADLTGHDEECDDAFARAYRGWVEQGQVERAARCAFWLGHKLIARGEPARGGGWIARARHLLADGRDCVEQGYVLLPSALQTGYGGDPATAHEIFSRAAEIGERFGDVDLCTLAGLGRGRTLIALQRVGEGLAILDEVMVAVTAAEVSPVVIGIVYCAVIDACQEIFDIRRAQEWTTALGQWCDAQPDMVAFRGACLVRRAELLQVRGAWPAAVTEAERAFQMLTRSTDQPSRGAAMYQLAELHRLRGEVGEAESAYREATRLGHNPGPGLALLRLAQGQVEVAVAAIDRALQETHDRTYRSRLLGRAGGHRTRGGRCQQRGRRGARAARAGGGDRRALPAGAGCPSGRRGAGGAKATAARRCRCCAGHWRSFRTLERHTRLPERASCMPPRARRSATRIRRPSNATRRAGRFSSSAPRPTWRGWTGRIQAKAVARGLTERELEVIRLVAAGKTNRAIAARAA